MSLLYISAYSLKPLDIEIMKRLGTRVNLIPVVAKADTVTPAEMVTFKQRVRESIVANNIRTYQPPIENDDPQAAEHAKHLIVSDSSWSKTVQLGTATGTWRISTDTP